MHSPVIFRVAAALLPVIVYGQTPGARFPYGERLSYRVEWHMITAGAAEVQLSRNTPDDWQIDLNLQSEGTVARLYRVLDKYQVTTDEGFCPATSELDAAQGKRHVITRLNFNSAAHQVEVLQKDLVKDSESKKELSIAPCTHDVVGALATLRTMNIEPGQWATVPVTNGGKMAFAKVHAQGRETLQVDGKSYQTIRCEAFLFNGVLYRRKGRLLIWLTDDSQRVPVRFQFQFGFPIGTVSLDLEKQEKL
jgi:hypothetical protein